MNDDDHQNFADVLTPHHEKTGRTGLLFFILAMLSLNLGCMHGMDGVGNYSIPSPPPDISLSPAGAYQIVLRFLEVEGPHTQPANYPGCVPGLPSMAIWGVAQNHPPVGRVELDSAGTSAWVRFQGSSGPGGSSMDGAIKFTPLPDQNACLMEYEDLRFTYTDGTSTYRGSRKVKYDSIGAFGSRAQEDQHLTLTRHEGANESTYHIYCYTDYTSGPPAPQGFWVRMSFLGNGGSDLISPDKPIRWLPDCNYPISGDLGISVPGPGMGFATSKAAATFGPASGTLIIKPLDQASVPFVLAPWPGQ